MRSFTLYCLLFFHVCLRSQSLQQYFFNNNFNGTSGGGPLTEVLSCSAGPGSFSTQSISTTSGFCSNSTAFCFNEGGGLSYPNTSITGQYSINLFFKFNTLSGYSRVIDFSTSTTDAGIYLLNDCLNFFPNGNVGPCPYFMPNVYYLFTFVRNGTTNVISVYVNGVLFGTYNDVGNIYRPATASSPIIFFRDDNTVPCEDKPGCISYASVSSSTLTPVQVDSVWQNICSIVSPCTAEAGNNASICQGQSAAIGGTPTATGGGGTFTYSWSPAAGLNSSTVANPVASPSSQTVYTVTINDGAGCITTDAVTVTVNSPPTILASPNATICPAGSATLTVSGAVSYTWSPGASLSSVNGSTVTASPLTTTIYTINGTSAGGCAGTRTLQVVVGTNPSITISPNATICTSGNTLLTAGGAASYTWSPATGLSSTNGPTVTATPAATTVYSVTGTNANGCVGSNTVLVTVSSTPNLVVNSATLCSGASATLTVTGATTYTWSPATGLNVVNSATVIASPTVTTLYTITGAGSGGCSGTQTVQVVVDANPVITVSSNATICATGTAVLTAGGAVSYTWAPAGSLSSANGPTVTASPVTTTIYTVSGSNANGCVGSNTISVTVAPTPSLTVNSATLCVGSSATLTASGATSYTWSPATGLSAVNVATVIANPSVTMVYTINGSNGTCASSVTSTVTVAPLNTIVTASSPTYCIGGTAVTLTASGATSYSWFPPIGLSSTSGSTVSATPTITTTYSVTGTSGICSSTSTITVTVNPITPLTITGSSTLICSNGTGAVLTASGASTYLWLPGFATTSTLSVNPSATTIYTVAGQTAAGCITFPATFTLNVSPAINATVSASSSTVCLGSTVSITASPSGGSYTYAWTPTSAIVGSSTTASITAKPTTTATVVYVLTISNGLCTETKTISLQPFNCVPPTTSFSVIGNDSICTNACVSFTATSTGIAPLSYQWFFPGGNPPFSNSSNPVICYNASGSYSVALVTTNPFGTDTVIKNDYIQVADTPNTVAVGDTLLLIGQTAPVRVTGGTVYSWWPNDGSIACPTCSATVVQPTVTTQYIVTAYNSPYCSKQDTILVRVDFTCGDFFVPNAFSPNNDGLNDYINIHGFCIATFKLEIYNRWGEKVFETTDKSNSWDGTHRGKPLDAGVFVYKADGITIDGKPFSKKGNITLVR